MKWFIVLMALTVFAASATAAGFRLPEAGAKAMGMGFAFSAQADDPSAIYFNPAGLVQLEGTNVMVGGTYIRENGGEFTGTTPLTGGATVTETQKDLDFLVPNAYIVRKASPNLAYGVGIFVPFGLGQEYKDRNASIFRSGVTKIDLQTVVVNPTIAFKLEDYFYFGAGIDYMWAKAKLARTGVVNNTFPPAAPPADNPVNLYNLDMEGDGDAWGYNFGLLLKPHKDWKLGFAFRSPFTVKIKDGDVTISNISSATIAFAPAFGLPAGTTFQAPGVVIPAGGTAGSSFATKGTTILNMPATAVLGLAYAGDRLTVEFDIDWTFWSSWRRLDIDIQQQGALLADINSQRSWTNVAAYRIGAEYRVSDALALRAGFVYDQTPVPSSTMDAFLPDADRLNYMAGAGYKYKNWTFDGAYMYVAKMDRDVANQTSGPFPSYGTGFNGTWKGDAHLLAFDIGYKF
jgi:long-chain fatty acid transport protein